MMYIVYFLEVEKEGQEELRGERRNPTSECFDGMKFDTITK